MTATRTDSEGLRVSVQLDPGMLVEALILQRLNAVPKRRHQDWIRSLLVQGFLAESRLVRQLNGTARENQATQHRAQQSRRSGFDFSEWLGRSANPKPVVRVTPDVPKEEQPSSVEQGNSAKPFAHLRKVVG